MNILQDAGQIYVQNAMKRNDEAANAALAANAAKIDFSVFEHIKTMHDNTRGVFEPMDAMELDEIQEKKETFKAAGLDDYYADAGSGQGGAVCTFCGADRL